MKFFTACLVLALAGTYVSAVEEEVAVAFIECVRKVLDGGLPEAQIPDHNPFVVTRNLTFNVNVGLANVLVAPTDLVILDIPLFNIDKIVGEYIDADNTTLKYDYSFSYKKFRIQGQYRVHATVLGLTVLDVSGSLNTTFNDFQLSGTWTQSTAGPRNRTLEALKLIIRTGEVDIAIDGLSDSATEVIESYGSSLEEIINVASDIPQVVDVISNGLAKQINSHWLVDGKQDRIDAIIANCQ